MEKQPVGICQVCRKTVYCDGGFLEGVVQDDHTLHCYACQERLDNELTPTD